MTRTFFYLYFFKVHRWIIEMRTNVHIKYPTLSFFPVICVFFRNFCTNVSIYNPKKRLWTLVVDPQLLSEAGGMLVAKTLDSIDKLTQLNLSLRSLWSWWSSSHGLGASRGFKTGCSRPPPSLTSPI